MSHSGQDNAGLAETLRAQPAGMKVFVLAEGLGNQPDIAHVTLFSVTEEVLVASNLNTINGLPAGSYFVINLDRVTAIGI